MDFQNCIIFFSTKTTAGDMDMEPQCWPNLKFKPPLVKSMLL